MCGKSGKKMTLAEAARALAAGQSCPPDPPNYKKCGIIIEEGECYCIYCNVNNPQDIIIRPCN